MRAEYQNSTTINTQWIENLALEEINMEDSGVVNFNDHLNPQSVLEAESIKFVAKLRDLFDIFVSKFNQLRYDEQSEKRIKIYKISNTINDFMLYRNSLKLIVARKSYDCISIGFLSNATGAFGARTAANQKIHMGIHEITAHYGAFSDIQWKFNGDPINQEALVRHYLTEFIKHSAN